MQTERIAFLRDYINKKVIKAKNIKDFTTPKDKRILFLGIDKSDFIVAYKEEKKPSSDIDTLWLWKQYIDLVESTVWEQYK